jgi:5-formyltetrahydrofolate cyclo-ligase
VSGPGEDRYSKRAWRTRLIAARREVSVAQHDQEAAALVTWLSDLPGDPVCAYVPIGTEPGTIGLLTALVEQGRRVLLPVVVGARALDWAWFDGPLVPGPFGLREPGGPRLGETAIALASAVLVPALAVDRSGHRLGKGGGHYDRSLPLARRGVPLVAVVRDDEVVAALPAEPHDVPMTAVLTPNGGLRPLVT